MTLIFIKTKSFDDGIKLIAVVNGVASMLHLGLWALAFHRLPSPFAAINDSVRMDLLVTYGIGVADLVFSMPLLFVGSVWLYRRKFAGFLAAQMANALWWYSFTFSFVRDLGASGLRPGTAMFLPFALFSVWAAWHLWLHRSEFPIQPDSSPG